MIVFNAEEEAGTVFRKYRTYPRITKTCHIKFMEDAVECDVDAVAKHGEIIRYALSEHVEPAGVHSGDSTLVYPSFSINDEIKKKIYSDSKSILSKLKVHGPCNIQFLIQDDTAYVIECNLRASRSVPFVSKVLHDNYITVATDVFLGGTGFVSRT